MSALTTTAVSPPIQALLSELKAKLNRLYGERLVDLILYGSHARGEASETSDVDVLVVLRGDVDPWKELWQMTDAAYELTRASGELISLYPVSWSRFNSSESPFLANARREGVSV